MTFRLQDRPINLPIVIGITNQPNTEHGTLNAERGTHQISLFLQFPFIRYKYPSPPISIQYTNSDIQTT